MLRLVGVGFVVVTFDFVDVVVLMLLNSNAYSVQVGSLSPSLNTNIDCL